MSDDRINTQVHVATSADPAALDAVIRKLLQAEKLIDKINKTGLGSITKKVGDSLGVGGNAATDFARRQRDEMGALRARFSFESRMRRQQAAEERQNAEDAKAFRADDLRQIREVMGVRSAMSRQQVREKREAQAAAERAANARTHAARETARAEERAARQAAAAWDRAQAQMSRGAGQVRSGATRAVVGGAVAAGVVGAGARRGLDSLTRSGVSIDEAMSQASIHVFGTMNSDAARAASMTLRKKLMPTAVKLGTSTADLIFATVEAAQAGVSDDILGQVTEMGAKYARMNKLELPSVLEETGYAIQGLKTFGKVTDETVGQFFNHSAYLIATTAANRTQMNSFAKRGLAAGASVGMSLDDTLAFGAAATASGAQGSQAARMLSTQTGRSAQWEMKSRDIQRKSRRSDEDRLFLQIPSLVGMRSFRHIASGLKSDYFNTFATIQEKLRSVADPLKRRAVEKELFGQEFGALTDSMVMGGNLRDYRNRLRSKDADNFLDKNWNKQEGSFGFILSQIKSVFANIKDTLGLVLKPIFADIRDFVVGMPAEFGNLEEGFRAGLKGFMTGLGSSDGTMAGLLKAWLGEPAGFALNTRWVQDFARGAGTGLREVGETIKRFMSAFTGGDTSAETLGRLTAKILGFSSALVVSAPAITILGGLGTAIMGFATIVSGAAAALRAAGLMGGATSAGKAAGAAETAAGATGILGLLGRLIPAFAMPLTTDASKADQDKLTRRLGQWAIEQERNRKAIEGNTRALIEKQSFQGDDFRSLIHRTALDGDVAASIQRATLSGEIARSAGAGSVGSVMGAAGIPYTPGAGGASLYGNTPGQAFSTPGVGSRYGVGPAIPGAGGSNRGGASLGPRSGWAGSGMGGADVPIATDGTITGLGSFGTSQYANVLGKRESGNRYGIRNGYGFSGRYQMGAGALQETGYFRSGRNRDLTNDALWTDKARAAGINSLSDFLANKGGIQDKQFVEYTNKHYRELSQRGVIRPGMKPNEIAGWLAAAHLKGVGGATALARGHDNVDANGTSASSYRRMMSGITGEDSAKAAQGAATALGKGIAASGNAPGGEDKGFTSSGWKKATPESLAKESSAEKLAREAPARAVGAAAGRGGGSTVHAPITIHNNGDAEHTANQVQRRVQDSINYAPQDMSFESI